MSFSIEAADDGSPRAALDVAGQAVRAFNHRSGQRFAEHRNGWNHVPDVYRCIGELTYLTGMLPQALGHMVSAMRAQLHQDQIAIDAGTTFETRPDLAVDAACAALSAAVTATRAVYDELARAQIAINAASYCGPEIDAIIRQPKL